MKIVVKEANVQEVLKPFQSTGPLPSGVQGLCEAARSVSGGAWVPGISRGKDPNPAPAPALAPSPAPSPRPQLPVAQPMGYPPPVMPPSGGIPALQQLTDMGFAPDAAQAALSANNGDLAQAVHALTSSR